MTPGEFIAKWRASELKECSAAQEHFNLCGGLMHADSPLGKETDYRALWEEGPAWEDRVMELLGRHEIRLVGQDGFCLVHMHEERDGRVHMYEFGRLNGQPPIDSQGGV